MGGLLEDGFIIFRNVISENDVEFARNAMTSGIDYSKLQLYIFGSMIKTINEYMNWNADFIKYRASDGNNSTDASVWHRDVFACNVNRDMANSYTLLSYLDDATLNVLVGSHKYMSLDPINALIQLATKKQTIVMHPTDLMLFNSGLIHCGNFNSKSQHRRLIQVFEVYPSSDLLKLHDKDVLHIKQWSKNQILQTLSKIPIIITFLNFFTYLTTSTGNGFVNNNFQKYYSSEGVRPRLEISVIPNTIQPDNCYIMMHNTTDATENETEYIIRMTMKIPNICYFLALLTIIVCIFLYIRKLRLK